MSDKQIAYIAGTGMVTPVGPNVEMTAAAVKAGISQYTITDFYTQNDEPVTMALVPEEFFTAMELEIDEGDYYGAQHERVIKMAITALRETLSQVEIINPVPLILAFPEPLSDIQHTFPGSLKTNLLAQEDLPIQKEMLHSIFTGRSGGILAMDLALRYLYDQDHDYVIFGASDSFFQCPRLIEFDTSDRLLSETNNDGFAPAEGAGFVLLTKHKKFAQEINQHVVALYEPGTGEESGHLYSEAPYLGEGLDMAFKKALSGFGGLPVDHVFSSMNGERYWSKEYGVAMMRNEQFFRTEVNIEHPIDCFGDIGVATGPVLISLAVETLFNQPSSTTSLVYCSSDGASRSALIMEKIPVELKIVRSQV